MDITSIDPTLLEWLYARETMRRLGFSPDELFFVIIPKGSSIEEKGESIKTDNPVLVLLTQAQDKEFIWTIGETKLSQEEIEEQYLKACEIWNSSQVLFEKYKESRPYTHKVELIAKLVSKGFVLGLWN